MRTTGFLPTSPVKSDSPCTTPNSTPPCRPRSTNCEQQADELRASRARVVASGDAERRRVERNLHDGAQQHLVALAVNLRLTKDVLGEDPAAAAEMLDELGHAVQETIQELRELAHGIYPPLLVDSGLGEALRAVANRSPLDIELITTDIGRYGGDVEAAVYFCCLEALQNAGKYAASAHVVVRVWEESGSLLFEVRDDGAGFDVRTAQRGHGYINMMDRLGAIGGAVRWESEVGHGTAIRGSLPLKQLTRELHVAALFPEPPQRLRAEFLLIDVGPGAAGRCFGREIVDLVGRTQDHEGLGQFFDDSPRRLDAAHLGHIDIHQHDIGVNLIRHVDRQQSVLGLADQFEALGTSNHRACGHTKRRLIIDNDDGKGLINHALSLSRTTPRKRVRWLS